MPMTFTEQDRKYMSLAIENARKGMKQGNYPCGAVLVAGDEMIGTSWNLKENHKDRISHAEELLYIKHSALLRYKKAEGIHLTMYTTLEPCLMCFGTAVMHRIDRIVAASPDPYGNISRLDVSDLGEFYATGLPLIEYGLLIDDSVELIKQFLTQKGGTESLKLVQQFEKLRGQKA